MLTQTVPSGTYVITGSNGFVGTHVLNDLLKRKSPSENFLVKAVVRSENSSKIVSEIFPKEISEGKLKIELVEDMLEEGAFDQVLKDATYAIHIAAATPKRFKGNPKDDLLDPSIAGVTQFLNSAHKAGTLKKVVLTSSIASILGGGKTKKHYTAEDWNPTTYEETVNSTDAFKIYGASKAIAEKSAWDFISEKKPSFTLTSINPAFVIGPILTSAHAPMASTTNDHVWRLATGSKETDADVCGWIDVRDVAKAHVEALFQKESDGQRFILYAGNVTSSETVQLAHEKFPDFKGWLKSGEEKKTPFLITYDTSNLKALGLGDLKTSDLKDEMVKILDSGIKLQSESKA